SVLLHMLTAVCDEPRVFTIDTGVLFEETLRTWKLFEERFGIRIEGMDARAQEDPWTISRCCSEAKVAAVNRALEGVDAGIPGTAAGLGSIRPSAASTSRPTACTSRPLSAPGEQ